MRRAVPTVNLRGACIRRRRVALWPDAGASARSTAGRDRGHRAGAARSQGGAGLCGRTDRPGIDPEDVDVTFEDGMLRIAGEKKEQREENERGYRVSERTYGAFERLIELPPAAPPGQD